MTRLTAKDFQPEVLQLFDSYVHGVISRRGFLERAAALAGSASAAAGLLAALNPQFVQARQVEPDDARLQISRQSFDSPQGHGQVSGTLARPSGSKGRLHRQNALLIAIDVFRFCDEATFRADVGRTIAAIKAMPADAAVGTVLAPGERGDREFARRSGTGIPLPPGIRAELSRLAAAAGVAVPWLAD